MRVYDTPTHWHYEPEIDPIYEDKMIELYGEDWEKQFEETKIEYEFYNFKDEE